MASVEWNRRDDVRTWQIRVEDRGGLGEVVTKCTPGRQVSRLEAKDQAIKRGGLRERRERPGEPEVVVAAHPTVCRRAGPCERFAAPPTCMVVPRQFGGTRRTQVDDVHGTSADAACGRQEKPGDDGRNHVLI